MFWESLNLGLDDSPGFCHADENISTAVGWIAMKFRWTNPSDSADAVSFNLVP